MSKVFIATNCYSVFNGAPVCEKTRKRLTETTTSDTTAIGVELTKSAIQAFKLGLELGARYADQGAVHAPSQKDWDAEFAETQNILKR